MSSSNIYIYYTLLYSIHNIELRNTISSIYNIRAVRDCSTSSASRLWCWWTFFFSLLGAKIFYFIFYPSSMYRLWFAQWMSLFFLHIYLYTISIIHVICIFKKYIYLSLLIYLIKRHDLIIVSFYYMYTSKWLVWWYCWHDAGNGSRWASCSVSLSRQSQPERIFIFWPSCMIFAGRSLMWRMVYCQYWRISK